MAEIEFGDAVDDVRGVTERFGQRGCSFDRSLLRTHVQRVDLFGSQILGHRDSLPVPEFCQAGVCAAGVVVDSFGSPVSDEYQLHSRRAYPCPSMRPTSCEIDLGAIAHNVQTLMSMVDPTPLCAVVKADGYGHGAVPVARAALEAGAQWLAVALVEEGIELRNAGIQAPVLVLSEPPPAAMALVVEHGLVPSCYTSAGIDAMATAARGRGPVGVQLVVDTGMRRVGVEPGALAGLVAQIVGASDLVLDGVWTHCPVADEPDNPFTEAQLSRFDDLVAGLDAGLPSHVGNSAVAITRAARTAAMVRCGISVYGIDPDLPLAGLADLRPALKLTSAVSFIKPIAAGDGVGYGLRWTASADTTIATVPIGYADGVRRDLGLRGGTVLIGGAHHPIVGVVTMDQLMVDVGGSGVAVGDEVVLIGAQGEASISAADVAATLETIPYEVVCSISQRVPRTYV